MKEIKKSLQQEIHLTEYVDMAYSENVRLDLLKDVLTLINELESENAYQKEHIEMWFRKNEEKKKRIAELEDKIENRTLVFIDEPFYSKSHDCWAVFQRYGDIVQTCFMTESQAGQYKAEAQLKELQEK